MKRKGLAHALQARKTLDEPERKPRHATSGSLDPEVKPGRRFHTTYYPTSKAFYDEIRIALIREGHGRDFNELVNDLLAAWLEAPGD